MKPVALLDTVLETTPFAETVYDPFVGSGTTIIAAERQGRACWAMELEPRYVDASVKRWRTTLAGRPAVSDGNLWERQSGETAKAYAAFLLYRDLPAIDRSVLAAREGHQRDTKGTLRQWKGWSMRNDWVNRAAEHDSDLASRRREHTAKELERAQDDAVVLIKAALDKVAERIEGMDAGELAAAPDVTVLHCRIPSELHR